MFCLQHKSIVFSTLLCYPFIVGGDNMAFNYKPLWKLLIDKEMSKKQLMEATGISKSTMDKMARNEQVSLDILDRICNYFNCNIEDIIEHLSED